MGPKQTKTESRTSQHQLSSTVWALFRPRLGHFGPGDVIPQELIFGLVFGFWARSTQITPCSGQRVSQHFLKSPCETTWPKPK